MTTQRLADACEPFIDIIGCYIYVDASYMGDSTLSSYSCRLTFLDILFLLFRYDSKNASVTLALLNLIVLVQPYHIY